MDELERIFGLDGQLAVVTGVAAGLGLAFATGLAGAGAGVVLIDLNGAGLEQAAAEIEATGRRAFQYRCDVSDEAQVIETFRQIARDIGEIDILVNNAGVGDAFLGPVHEYPSDQWHRVIDVNLNSVFYRSREALEGMYPRRKGKIINIASMWGLVGGGLLNIAGYSATKGALVNLARELALQYAPSNIQINAICPGFHRTALAANNADSIPLMEQYTPAGRIAEASELQGTVIYLASSASNFMSGSIVVVDGGVLSK